jgi:ATP-dependent Zn protease
LHETSQFQWTLLARAVAGTAVDSLTACSASDFVEVYVGRGAAVCDPLFRLWPGEEAKAKQRLVNEIDHFGGSIHGRQEVPAQ